MLRVLCRQQNARGSLNQISERRFLRCRDPFPLFIRRFRRARSELGAGSEISCRRMMSEIWRQYIGAGSWLPRSFDSDNLHYRARREMHEMRIISQTSRPRELHARAQRCGINRCTSAGDRRSLSGGFRVTIAIRLKAVSEMHPVTYVATDATWSHVEPARRCTRGKKKTYGNPPPAMEYGRTSAHLINSSVSRRTVSRCATSERREERGLALFMDDLGGMMRACCVQFRETFG